MSILVRDEEKEKINSFPYNSKTHSKLKEKSLLLFMPKTFDFLITRVEWLVTYIYAHYTFEQSKFKREFIIMNQKVKQVASTKVEKKIFTSF